MAMIYTWLIRNIGSVSFPLVFLFGAVPGIHKIKFLYNYQLQDWLTTIGYEGTSMRNTALYINAIVTLLFLLVLRYIAQRYSIKPNFPLLILFFPIMLLLQTSTYSFIADLIEGVDGFPRDTDEVAMRRIFALPFAFFSLSCIGYFFDKRKNQPGTQDRKVNVKR
jgi:glycopeptide antibiotics resistance protein